MGKILDWELLRDEIGKDNNEFQLWFDERYPDIAREAKDLLVLIDDIGYETPEKQIKLFRRIIQAYRLEKVVVV